MNSKKRLYELDSIKGLAALVICVWHYQHFGISQGPFAHVLDWGYHYGWLAVELFFMLSGFAMFYVYVDRIATGKIRLKEYMEKRIFHFFPLMIITLIVMTVFQIINVQTLGGWIVYGRNDILHFVLNVLMIHGGVLDTGDSFNGPSWCITVELICYFILFVVVKNAEKDKDKLFINIAMVLVLSLFVVRQSWSYPVINALVMRGVLCFFIGCVLCQLYTMIVRIGRQLMVGIGCLVLLIGIALMYYFGSRDLLVGGDSTQLLMVFCFSPCIIMIALFIPIMRSILRFKPLVYLGKISFSMYMWHVPVQFAIMITLRLMNVTWDFTGIIPFFVFIISTILVAVISYEIYEKKMKKIIDRIYKKGVVND